MLFRQFNGLWHIRGLRKRGTNRREMRWIEMESSDLRGNGRQCRGIIPNVILGCRAAWSRRELQSAIYGPHNCHGRLYGQQVATAWGPEKLDPGVRIYRLRNMAHHQLGYRLSLIRDRDTDATCGRRICATRSQLIHADKSSSANYMTTTK